MLLRNLLLAIGIFALIAGSAVGVAWIFRSNSATAPAGAKVEAAAILVASHPIPAGALLREEDMTWRETAPGQATAASFVRGQASPTQLAGAVTRRSFAGGETFSRAALVLPSQRGFLAAVLAPGDRAVTITVDTSQSASGLVLPGDRVDVVLVQTLDREVADVAHKTVGETVLDNARVVAVDTRLQGVSGAPSTPAQAAAAGAAPQVGSPKTITLEVSADDAQRLFVASQLGKLELSLRSLAQPQSASAVVAGPTWASDVSPALQALARNRPKPPQDAGPALARAPGSARAPAIQTVTILRGAKAETQ